MKIDAKRKNPISSRNILLFFLLNKISFFYDDIIVLNI